LHRIQEKVPNGAHGVSQPSFRRRLVVLQRLSTVAALAKLTHRFVIAIDLGEPVLRKRTKFLLSDHSMLEATIPMGEICELVERISPG
jgi:hypothetical protein